MPWSMNSPSPTSAAGWISMPVTVRAVAAIARGASGTPASSSAWATRWASSAWTPGQRARISSEETPRAAGSRSWAAATSWRSSRATRATVRIPIMGYSVAQAATPASATAGSGGLDAPDAPATALLHQEDRRHVAVRFLDRGGGVGSVRNVDVLHGDLGPGREELLLDLLGAASAVCRLRDGVGQLRREDLGADALSVTRATCGLDVRHHLLHGGVVDRLARGVARRLRPAARAAAAAGECRERGHAGHGQEPARAFRSVPHVVPSGLF